MSGSVTQWGLSYPRRGGRFSRRQGWDSVGSDVAPLCSMCLEEGPRGEELLGRAYPRRPPTRVSAPLEA